MDHLTAEGDCGIASANVNYILEEEFDDTLLDDYDEAFSFPSKIFDFEAANTAI